MDKANKAVFDKVTEFLQNDKMIKAVVDKLNREHEERIAPANKQLNTIERELQKQKKNGIMYLICVKKNLYLRRSSRRERILSAKL